MSLGNFSPRGITSESRKSQLFRDAIKAGRASEIQKIIDFLHTLDIENVSKIIDKETTLVPIPRSSPIVKDSLWPSLIIAETLQNNWLGKEVIPYIERILPVKKSSNNFSAISRPEVKDHYESLRLIDELIFPTKITLVDDILTLGRTAAACALRIKERHPRLQVNLLVLLRTRSFEDEIAVTKEATFSSLYCKPHKMSVRREDG